MTVEEIRAWAGRCASATRGLMAEAEAWDLIAERGEEWVNSRLKFPLMTKKQCFTNSARIVLGLTKLSPAGLRYAEGFALSSTTGMWFHHGWVVTESGLVLERTWNEPADRYVGVALEPGEWLRCPGVCQLSDWPVGMPWGQHYADHPELLNRLFSRSSTQAGETEVFTN